MMSSLKILEELECAFGVVGKILMRRRFNGIYLVRFEFRMWEILITIMMHLEMTMRTTFSKRDVNIM
jgi:hypothetical protein